MVDLRRSGRSRRSAFAFPTPLVTLLIALLAPAAPAGAQTNADINAGLQFSFIPPGARSLALGGAFTGLADDATAAWTNPAGLVNLSRTEVSVEARDATYANDYVSGGSFQPDPSQVGFGASESDVTSLSFASFVHPAQSGRWSAAVFYHQLSDFRARMASEPIGDATGRAPISAREGFLDLEIPGLGVAGAFRVTDTFSIGASLVHYDVELESETLVLPEPGSPPGTPADRQVMSASDHAVAGSIGLQWAGAATRWSLVYRRSPGFDVDYAYVCGTPGAVATVCNDLHPGELVPGLHGVSTLRTPDSAALGFAWSATSHLTIAADVNQVFYSQLSDEIANVQTVGLGIPDYAEQFEIEDATEVHLGFELALPAGAERSFFLRAGGWLDPDHRLRYTGDIERVAVRFNLIEEHDELHLTGGVGFTLGSRFQVDLAADFSDLVDIVSASAVFRF